MRRLIALVVVEFVGLTAIAAITLRDPVGALVSVTTGPTHVRSYRAPRAYTADEWEAMCRGIEVSANPDDPPRPARCEITVIVDCPDDCDLFASAQARPSVRQIR